MTSEEIIALANKAGLREVKLSKKLQEMRDQQLEKFAALVAAAEREAVAQLEQAQADAARMREAVEDAAYEWAKYVEVDTAPRTLLEHMRNAMDTARAALEGGK